MTAFVDTNVIVRHLTGDPPDLASRASRYIERGQPLLLPDLILAEVAYVLASFYKYDRVRVADGLRTTITSPGIRVVDLDLLIRTVDLYETHRLDFADAYLIAIAERSGIRSIVSFDRDFDRVGTVSREEPV